MTTLTDAVRGVPRDADGSTGIRLGIDTGFTFKDQDKAIENLPGQPAAGAPAASAWGAR